MSSYIECYRYHILLFTGGPKQHCNTSGNQGPRLISPLLLAPAAYVNALGDVCVCVCV